MARNPLFSSYKGETQNREPLRSGTDQRHSSSSSGSSRAGSQVHRSASRQQDVVSGGGSRSDRGQLSLSRQRQQTRTGSGNVRQGGGSLDRSDQGGGDLGSGNQGPQTKSGNMSNGSSSLSENSNQPPSKRRKTEETTDKDKGDIWDDDDDDDDFDFTQADLEQMDIMASQAIASNEESVPQEPTGPSKSVVSESATSRVNTAKLKPPTGSYQTASTPKSATSAFIKPKILMTSSSSTSSSDRSRETSINESTESGPGSRRSSSESGTSSYPSSLSHVGSRESSLRSSSSIRSVSSDEVGPGQLRRQGSNPTQNASESSVDLSVGALIRSPQSRALKEELDKYKNECGNLKQQIEKVQLEKEGEIKILRENLNKKETEISSMKQEKVNEIDRVNRAQSEKEKQLQSEVSKLTTQLQFKERDLGNMKEKLQNLESRLTHSDIPQTSPVRSQAVVVSPKRRKVGKESPKSGFPTQQSFMSLERSPVIPVAGLSTSRTPNIEVTTRDASTCTSLSTVKVEEDRESVRRQRRLGLGINMNKGNLSGSALVANLIEAVPDISDTNSERGIVGLLQSRTLAMDLVPFHFDRDSNNSLLSPIPNKRLNELRHDSSTESTESLLLVSPENYDLALEGMSCLLREESHTSSTKNDKTILTDIESVLDTSIESNSTCSLSQNILSNHSAAIYFLPLLNDYLSHYLEMLCTSVNCVKSPPTPKSSNSSSKASSSDIESVTSSLELLLKNSASYANNLENLATISLRILYKLVSHSGAVRDILLSLSLLEDTSDTTKEISEMETDQSSSSSSSSPPSSSSFSGSLTIIQPVIDLHLLSKVFRLAHQGQNEHKCSTQVTKTALGVLTVLATHTKEANLDRLLPAVTDGVIVSGLENESNVSIVLQSVDLLNSFTRHIKIVNLLCTGPDRREQDNCILYSLYTVCIHSVVTMSNKDFVELANKVLELLLNIQGIHHLGISTLTNEDCDCSLEVVKCIVLMLHQILQIFEETNDIKLLNILKKGLVLLHMIIMKEDPLVCVQNQVEYQFIRLIYGLEHVFKSQLQGNFSSEISLIHDLMDFHQDDSELSHDSEEADTQ